MNKQIALLAIAILLICKCELAGNEKDSKQSGNSGSDFSGNKGQTSGYQPQKKFDKEAEDRAIKNIKQDFKNSDAILKKIKTAKREQEKKGNDFTDLGQEQIEFPQQQSPETPNLGFEINKGDTDEVIARKFYDWNSENYISKIKNTKERNEIIAEITRNQLQYRETHPTVKEEYAKLLSDERRRLKNEAMQKRKNDPEKHKPITSLLNYNDQNKYPEVNDFLESNLSGQMNSGTGTNQRSVDPSKRSFLPLI